MKTNCIIIIFVFFSDTATIQEMETEKEHPIRYLKRKDGDCEGLIQNMVTPETETSVIYGTYPHKLDTPSSCACFYFIIYLPFINQILIWLRQFVKEY